MLRVWHFSFAWGEIETNKFKTKIKAHTEYGFSVLRFNKSCPNLRPDGSSRLKEITKKNLSFPISQFTDLLTESNRPYEFTVLQVASYSNPWKWLEILYSDKFSREIFGNFAIFGEIRNFSGETGKFFFHENLSSFKKKKKLKYILFNFFCLNHFVFFRQLTFLCTVCFNTYAKLSGKVTFLITWYAHLVVRIGV